MIGSPLDPAVQYTNIGTVSCPAETLKYTFYLLSTYSQLTLNALHFIFVNRFCQKLVYNISVQYIFIKIPSSRCLPGSIRDK